MHCENLHCSNVEEKTSLVSSKNQQNLANDMNTYYEQVKSWIEKTICEHNTAQGLEATCLNTLALFKQQKSKFSEKIQQQRSVIQELHVVEEHEKQELEAVKASLYTPATAALKLSIKNVEELQQKVEQEISAAREAISLQAKLVASLTERSKNVSATRDAIHHRASGFPTNGWYNQGRSRHSDPLCRKTSTPHRAKLKIFHSIARQVHWSVDSSDEEISGFICLPNRRDVTPFRYSLNTTTQSDITDMLWMKMEDEGETLAGLGAV